MRKFKSLSLLLLAITFIAINCTKEGPEGPAGATGPQGPAGSTGSTGATGPTGPSGSANVIYSSWITQSSWADTIFANYTVLGTVSRSIRLAPGVTQSVIDQGIVLCYMQPTAAGGVFPLPLTGILGPDPDVQINFILSPGKVIYYVNNFTTGDASGITPIAPFRYIIIPGSVAGGRMKNPRTMTYAEVCAAYNIPM